MYKRYYDGYQNSTNSKNCGEIVVPEAVNEAENHMEQANITSVCDNDIALSGTQCKKSGLNLPFELDDLILIGILLFLLFDKDDSKKDDDNDILTLLVIGFIVLSDIF